MPRPDGTPTIKEILRAESEPVVFRGGHSVRYKSRADGHVAWVFGTVLSRVQDGEDDWDASYNVRLADGSEIVRRGDEMDDLEGPRDPDRPWPPEQDCTHCPGQAGPQGKHAFGCDLHGVRSRQTVLNAVEDPDGKLRVLP